jgi:hypothetical protein
MMLMLDMVIYFRIEETGISAGGDQARLVGETLDTTPFEACDAIVTPSPVEAATAPVAEPSQFWQLMSGWAGLSCMLRLRRRA